MNASFFKADLHCHSTCSDGSSTPRELLKLAKEIQLNGISITDHDTVEAYREAPLTAKEYNIKLVSGVEFSTTFNEKSVHLLGYGFDVNHIRIRELCTRHETRREKRNKLMLEKLAKKNLIVTEQDLQDVVKQSTLKTTIGRPHIAMVLLNKGYVETVKDAFSLYIGDNAPCFAKSDPITTEESVEAIHEAGGFAVIAHPHLFQDGSIVNALLSLPIDGIESYYSSLALYQNQRWIDLAAKNSLFITGGSDFHGDIKPTISLGNAWTGEEVFNILYASTLRNNPSFA